MAETKPLISVIMSVYNGEKYLSEAIRSILNQSYENIEFVIINDGSTDNSEKIVSGFIDSRIRYEKRPNSGLAASLNYAVKMSTGKLIARMDSDDIAYPERICVQCEYLMSHADCVLIGSNADIIDEEGNYLYTSKLPSSHTELSLLLKNASPFFHSSVVYKKEIFNMCGGYYEPIRQHVEDFILWNKFINYGKMYNTEKPLIKYRLTPGGLSNRNKRTTNRMISTAKDIIEGKTISEKQMNVFMPYGIVGKSKKMSNYYSKIGCIYLYVIKDKKKASTHFRKSLSAYCLNYRALFLLILSAAPWRIIKYWKYFRKIT